MKDCWLITGAAGFAGSHFVKKALQQTEATLILLDALTYAGDLTRLSLALAHPRTNFVQADVNDENALKTILTQGGVTHVIHFAAETHVDRAIRDPKPFVETNVMGTFRLLENIRQFCRPAVFKLFLHVSTDEVFGDVNPDLQQCDEQTRLNPRNPYAATKAAAEHFVQAWHETYYMPSIIVRSSNLYGEWQFPEKLIPHLIHCGLQNKKIPIYGDGTQRRDWLYVEDYCEALLHIIATGVVGESYHVSAREIIPNIDLVRQVCQIMDDCLKRKRKTADLIQFVPDRIAHDRAYSLDAGKIKKTLAWMPQHSLNQNLPGLVDWYIQHQDWLMTMDAKEHGSHLFNHR